MEIATIMILILIGLVILLGTLLISNADKMNQKLNDIEQLLIELRKKK